MIKDVKIGQIIKVQESADECKEGCRIKIEKVYEVIGIYKHHVLCKNKIGIRRSFSYGDLICLGLEKQSTEIEGMRNIFESGKYA